MRPPSSTWWLVVRTLILGAAAIVGAGWGLARHLTHSLPPLEAPNAEPAYDPDAGEIPAPELLSP